MKGTMPQSLFDSNDASWGMGWVVWPCGDNQCIGHAGGSSGYTAVVAGNLERRSGVAILTNSDAAERVLVELAADLMRLMRAQYP